MKYSDLTQKSPAELVELLKEKKKELFMMRIQQKTMQLQKTSELRRVKKEIARINTAITVTKAPVIALEKEGGADV